jgi:tetratricopeptide (TPR) repeat protein
MRIPASGIRITFPVSMSALILLFALVVAPIAPASADAGISKRIKVLSTHIDQSPEDQALRLQRALAYVDDNQPELALADIKVAQTLGDPLAADYTYGVLLYRQGDNAAARPYFDRYLQAYPEDWGALGYRARLLRDLGENRLALADYETLIRLNNALDPGYYVVAARLMASLPDRGTDEALALLDQRIAQRGAISSLQRYAIELETQRGNYPAAIARMATLDEKLRASPQWQLDVAELLLQAGRAQEARSYLAVAQEQLQAGRMTTINRQLLETAQRLQAQALGPVDQVEDISPAPES